MGSTSLDKKRGLVMSFACIRTWIRACADLYENTNAACIGSLLCATVLAISLAPAAEITPSQLEAQLALIKKRTEERIASSKSDHDALTPAARLAAPPNIWMVDGVLTEFKECAECPLMVVIPAGEFTMGSPSAEQGAEKEHRVTLA